MTNVQYDRYSFILDGTRTFIRSGAMHYFRLPSQSLWKDRLFKLKVAGYNTVDIYFNWGFHSSKEGQYDFSGIRDVRRLLETAKELGLWVIARPGPYINAEVSGGGFPMWLIAKKDVPLRNRKAGQMVWSDEYMGYVRQWWEQILPLINSFDNILMMQIENEYSTLDVEPDYIQALYQMARDLGVKVPLSHNDLFIAGLYEDIVDLYTFDNYSVTQFENNWRKMKGVFSVLDNIETNIRPFCQKRPLIAAELQAGWFGMWKGNCYNSITESLGREHINLSTKTVISQGLTAFNHYKAIGGTNWAHIGSNETYTSYDFGAPISEVGINTIRLFEAKSLNYLLESFSLTATEPVDAEADWPFEISNPEALLRVRKNVEPESANTYWLFIRNFNEQTLKTDLRLHNINSFTKSISIEVSPHGFVILPQHITLECGLTLAYTNVEPIYQNADYLIFKGSSNTVIALHSNQALSVESEETFSNSAIEAQTAQHEDQYLLELAQSTVDKHDIAACKVVYGNKLLTVLFLGEYWSDRFWQDKAVLGQALLLGPDTLLDKSTYSLNKPEQGLYRLEPNGKTHPISLTSSLPVPILPKLNQWNLFDAAPELHSEQSFHTIKTDMLDLDANQQYEGSAWYSVSLGTSGPKSIQLDATHVWAVYLNGHSISQGHYLSLLHDETENPLIRISLPVEYFQTENNTLLIFVDSLGHPKGFHDDQQDAQGLLRLFIDGVPIQKSPFVLKFSGGLANETVEPLAVLQGTQNSPLLYATSRFRLPNLSGWDVSLGLNLKAVKAERVNLYLNGVLIGRYWEACQAQSSFYLPPGILKLEPDAQNEIGLLLMDFDMSYNAQEWFNRLSQEDIASLNAYKMAPTFNLNYGQ